VDIKRKLVVVFCMHDIIQITVILISLCNACGLRYARLVAKHERQQQQQQREDESPPPILSNNNYKIKNSSTTNVTKKL
jgi:hypothetical protein